MYPALPVQRPAGRPGAPCRPPGPDLGGAAGPAVIGSGITWYDVLGVLPGAEADKIRRTYEDKAGLLRPDLVRGAPPEVAAAVSRARQLLDTAWEVLGDPGSRRRYDEAAGLRRAGGGLGPPGTGTGPAGRDRPGAVPDVRGLFYHVCLEVATRRGLHVRTVRLTGHPMAVDGLVVGQDPRPPGRARRGGTLTVQVWHPPARPAPLAGPGRPPRQASPLAGSGPQSRA